MLNRVKFPLVDRFTDKRRSNIWWPIRKIHTTKPKKENQNPKQKHRFKTEAQDKTRITKYKIESYNVKKWKFSLMPVIQNKHSKPGNKHPKPLKKKHTSKTENSKPETERQVPKRKHKNQNYKIPNRIIQFKKNWKFSLMPVIQNKHSKPGNRRAKP